MQNLSSVNRNFPASPDDAEEGREGYQLPPLESLWLVSTSHDQFVWEKMRKSSPRLSLLIEEVAGRIPTIEALILDLFCTLYRFDVRWKAVGATDPLVEINRAILDRVLTSPSYHRLHPGVAGDEEDSIMVLDAFTRAFANSLDPDLVEFFDAEASFYAEKQKLEEETSHLQELIENRTRPHKRGVGDKPTPENMTAAERQARLNQVANEMEELEQAYYNNYKVRRVQTELRQYLDEVDVPGQLEEIAQSFEDFRGALSVWAMGWGVGNGLEDELPLEERLDLFKHFIESETLRRATELLGRARFTASGTHSTLTRAAPVQILGYEWGDDLTLLSPSEAVWLSDEDTSREFYRRYAEHELLVRKYEMKGNPDKGPVIVLVDESSSMSGEPAMMAKAIGLAIIGIACNDKRKAALIEFSSHGQQRVTHFEPEENNIPAIISLLGHFFGGGTDFDAPLIAALKLTGSGKPKDAEGDERYKSADVIIISDGQAQLDQTTIDLILKNREDGVRLFAICVGVDDRVFRDVATRTWPLADLLGEENKSTLVPDLVEAIH